MMDVSQIWDEHNWPWRAACCTLKWRLAAHLASDDTMTRPRQQPAAGSDVISSGESRELSCEPRPSHHTAQNAHNTPVRCHSFYSRDTVTWFDVQQREWLARANHQRFCLLPLLGILGRLSAGHLWYCTHYRALFWGCQTTKFGWHQATNSDEIHTIDNVVIFLLQSKHWSNNK